MYKKVIILFMSAAVLLSACQGKQVSEVTRGSEVTRESVAETTAETTEGAAEEATAAEKTTALSNMDEISSDSTLEDLIAAFQEDYVRAADQAGVQADHNDLSYEISDPDMVVMDLSDGLTLIAQISPNSKMMWYAGYPEDEAWFQQEMQLVLMAADSTLAPEEAKTFADEIWDEAWDNRNNMPSAVQKRLPSGLLYTMSLNERRLVSFQVIYQN
jgi:hypothetical protein